MPGSMEQTVHPVFELAEVIGRDIPSCSRGFVSSQGPHWNMFFGGERRQWRQQVWIALTLHGLVGHEHTLQTLPLDLLLKRFFLRGAFPRNLLVPTCLEFLGQTERAGRGARGLATKP